MWVDTASWQDFHPFLSILHPKSQPTKKLCSATFTLRHSKKQLAGNSTEADARGTQPKSDSVKHMAGLSGHGESWCPPSEMGLQVSSWAWAWHWKHNKVSTSDCCSCIRGGPSVVPLAGSMANCMRALLFSTPHSINYLHSSGTSAGNLQNISEVNIC